MTNQLLLFTVKDVLLLEIIIIMILREKMIVFYLILHLLLGIIRGRRYNAEFILFLIQNKPLSLSYSVCYIICNGLVEHRTGL